VGSLRSLAHPPTLDDAELLARVLDETPCRRPRDLLPDDRGGLMPESLTGRKNADDIANIKSTMATKADIADMATKDDVRIIVRDELKPIRSDLKSIRDELDDLTEKLENVSGFRKEIDHALERIAAIERHLRITKKLAA
jgi:hypothetical protein